MATASQAPDRFKLPSRIRTGKGPSNGIQTRLALIDRIADLRGIEIVECRDDTVPRQVDVYLQRDTVDRARKKPTRSLFCSLDSDGVTINGLDRWAQHQVVSRGWGKLISHRVLVFLPRDSSELDVVWKILQRAYDHLVISSARESGTHVVSTRDLPKYSRTTLQ